MEPVEQALGREQRGLHAPDMGGDVAGHSRCRPATHGATNAPATDPIPLAVTSASFFTPGILAIASNSFKSHTPAVVIGMSWGCSA